MEKLWDRLEADGQRVDRIKAVATWKPYNESVIELPFGGTDLWAMAADPGLLAEADTRWFALSPLRGELRYFANQADPGQAFDFELGVFATLDDALTFAVAFLVDRHDLRDIAVPREVQLAELAAKPGTPIPRHKLQYHEPPPLPPPFMRRWFSWLISLNRALTAPLRLFFGGYTGCITLPAMAILILPCILFAGFFVSGHGVWAWIKTLALGVAAAVVLTVLVYVLAMLAIFTTLRKGREKSEVKGHAPASMEE